jgi:type IV pilus modification protein PilV
MIKHANNNLTDDTGFTLIEILIAISIFAIGFLAVSSLQLSAGKSNRTASEITLAANIASDQMERLINLPSDDADLDPAANPHSDSQGKYNIEWVVTNNDINSDGVDDAKIVNLTVTWNALLVGGTSQRSIDMDFIKPNI